MPLTNTQYASIMRLYDDIKTANRRMQSDRYNEVTALCPDIANIDSEIIDLSVKTARARIEADSSDTNTDELTSSLKSLNERKVAALASIGKPADYLDDIFTCPYCKDSGYVNGKRCICFNKKAIDLIYKDSNLKNITADENFNTFSLSWYNNTDVDPATGLTPYINMQKVLKVCHDFVDNFDNTFSNLFNTINERLLRRKSIIISSNLEMPDIETRYSQRIFSRLVSAYSILRLFGDDIRCMKKLSPTKRS